MSKIIIDQTTGFIDVNSVVVGPHSNFHDLHNIFLDDLRLIYGKDGTGKYGLKTPVMLFDEEFWLYFRFEKNRLRDCSILLISGIVKDRVAEYPSYSELQEEVEYLFRIYVKNFRGNFFSEYEWNKTWQYEWGKISLTQVIQNSQVVTGFLWA